MPSLSEDNINVVVNTRADTSGIDKTRKSIDNLDRESERSSNRVGSFFKKNFNAAGVAAGIFTGTLTLATGAALKQAGSLEQTRLGFETMLKSGEKANTLLGQISKFAAETPFEFPELAQSARLLLAFGDTAEEVLPHLTIIGDTVAAMGGGAFEIDRVTRALGQMEAKGKVSAEEMNQLSEIGINGFALLSQEMGKTEGELRDLAAKGELMSKDSIPLLYEGMRKAFGGGMQKQAGSLNGLVSTLNDTIGMTVRKLVGIDEGGNIREGSIFAVAKQAIEALIPFLERLQPKLEAFSKWVADNKIVIAAFAGALGGILVLAVGALIAAFGGALLVMAAFALAGAAIGALAYLIVTNWSTIREFFSNLWKNVTQYASTAFNFVVDKLKWLKDNWAYAIGFMLMQAATLPIKIPIYAFAAVRGIINVFRSVDWFSVFAHIWWAMQAVWDRITDAVVNAWHFIHDLRWSDILSGVARGVGNAIVGFIEGAINGALSGIPGSPKVSIPRFAKGTNYAPGGLALVGERGPELVNLPRGSQVIPADKTAQMTNGITMNNTYNVYNEVDLNAANYELGWRLANV